ncbi:alpha/beta fold hydrolase [Tsukamurella strandjordii]|nr:alpha/beta hydrolase [Tsukamurella sp. TY48]
MPARGTLTSMELRRYRVRAIAAVAVLLSTTAAPLTVSAAPLSAEPPPDPGLRTCSEVVPGFGDDVKKYQLSPELAAELECGFLDVPVDYAKPDGPTTKVAFSRLPASDPGRSRGVLMTHSGGPGGPSLTYPIELASRPIGEVVREYDTVSLDYRGLGKSDPYLCGAPPSEGTDDPTEARFRAEAAAKAAANQAVARCQPDFTRTLTTPTIARDIDRIRDRLKVDKVAFYGVSYGTVVGMTYRALFDDRVSRMWLDSPVDPEMTAAGAKRSDYDTDAMLRDKLLDELAAQNAAYGFGATADDVRRTVLRLADDAVRRIDAASGAGPRADRTTVIDTIMSGRAIDAANDLLQIRDGGLPSALTSGKSDPATPAPIPAPPATVDVAPGEGDTYLPIYCGFTAGGRDADETWSQYTRLRSEVPKDSLAAAPTYPSTICLGWPYPADRPDWGSITSSSPLMLGGHRYERSTPYSWATNAKKVLRGSLLTVNDGRHSGTIFTQCGADRITQFLRGGDARDGECLTEEGKLQ